LPLDPGVAQAIRLGFASQHVPRELQEAVLTSAGDVVDHYVAGRTGPSELSGGHFAEAVARVIQFLGTGSYAPLGKTLVRFPDLMSSFKDMPLDDAMRLHVPRLLQVLYDVRNRRGVGHLPGTVSANRSDAELILTSVKWVLVEFVRLYHLQDHAAAQHLVDRLMVRHVPHVESFDGALRVVTAEKVSIPDAIVILLGAAGGEVHRSQLVEWTRAGSAQFSTALKRLDDRNLIHRFADGRIRLTTLGDARSDSLNKTLSNRVAWR
jgi:hypothetical protein